MGFLQDLINCRLNARLAEEINANRTRIALLTRVNENLDRELSDTRTDLQVAIDRAVRAEEKYTEAMQKFIDWQSRRAGEGGVFQMTPPEPRSNGPINLPPRPTRTGNSLSDRCRENIATTLDKVTQYYRDLGVKPDLNDADSADATTQ